MTFLPKTSQRGFTLLELVIALGLSSIVIGAGFAMFVSSNRVYNSTGMVGRAQQTARATLDLIASEVKMAGFGTVDQGAASSMTNPEDEVAISSGSANGYLNNASDVLQFKMSGNAMAITGEDTTIASLQGGSATIVLNANHGRDLLRQNMEVDIFDLERRRVGTARIDDLSGTEAGSIKIANFSVDAEYVASATLPAGSIIVEKAMYITYRMSGGKLVRCARKDNGGERGCSIAYLNVPSTEGDPDPDTYYIISDNVIDLQFSYLVDLPLSELRTKTGCAGLAESVFLPTPNCRPDFNTLALRQRIVAVKIEILVTSQGRNPIIVDEDCSRGLIQRKFYLGDHPDGYDIGTSIDACKHSYTQMSTIVYMPNMYGYHNRSAGS